MGINPVSKSRLFSDPLRKFYQSDHNQNAVKDWKRSPVLHCYLDIFRKCLEVFFVFDFHRDDTVDDGTGHRPAAVHEQEYQMTVVFTS
jgi:hypothetical protein